MNEVKITREHYQALLDAREELTALEVNGVDNWAGYHDSLEGIWTERDRKKKREDLITDLLVELSEHIDEPAGREAGYSISGSEPYDIVEEFLKEVKKLEGK